MTDPVAQKTYMRDMYAREAGELAKEAQYRYGRLGEVRAFLFLAVASLAMSLVIVLDALSHHYANGAAAPWSQPTAVGTGLVLLALTFVAGHDRVRIEADNWTPAVGRGTTVWLLRINVRSLSMFAGLAVCAINGSSWYFGAALLCLVPSFWALGVRRRNGSTTFRVMDRVSGPILGVAAISLIALYAFPEARPFLFAAALAPLIVFEGIRLIDLLELLLTLGGRTSQTSRAVRSLATWTVSSIRRVKRPALRRKAKARNQP
jgi:hypothetical protein